MRVPYLFLNRGDVDAKEPAVRRIRACLLCGTEDGVTWYHVTIETQKPGQFFNVHRILNYRLGVCERCYVTITRMGLLSAEEVVEEEND